MKKYTDSQIDTCMETIYNNCNDSKFEWRGESLERYVNTPDKIYLIRYLNENGYIISKETDGIPSYIRLTPAGLNYFKILEDIKGVKKNAKIANICSIIAATTAVLSLVISFVSVVIAFMSLLE